jgi:tetratricopeptide (TPR) repeat protein
MYPLALSQDGDQVTEEPKELPLSLTPVKLTNPEYSLIPRAADLSAFTGEYAAIRATLAQGDKPAALKQAQRYLDDNAGGLLPLLALGEAAEENRDFDLASRAYGSLVDLLSQDPQIQWIAAQRLSHLSVPSSQALARESYRQILPNLEGSIEPTRELAYLMTQMGDPARAFELLTRLLDSLPDGAPGELLKRDLGIIAKVLLAREPGQHVAVEKTLRLWGIKLNSKPSHLFVVSTTLGKDVEFEIYAAPNTGRFDGTRIGYREFDFVVDGAMHQAPYTLRVRTNPATLYSDFDMLPKIGQVHLVSHDGKGHLSVEGRPFVFLHSPAEIDLGQYGVAPLEPDATPSLRAVQ